MPTPTLKPGGTTATTATTPMPIVTMATATPPTATDTGVRRSVRYDAGLPLP